MKRQSNSRLTFDDEGRILFDSDAADAVAGCALDTAAFLPTGKVKHERRRASSLVHDDLLLVAPGLRAADAIGQVPTDGVLVVGIGLDAASEASHVLFLDNRLGR